MKFLIFRRVRKTAKSDYYHRHVRPDVSMEQSVPTGRISIKLDIWAPLRKSVEKIQVSLKSQQG